MKDTNPTLIHCFLQTFKACLTNLACAPFFLFAILFYAFYYCWPYEAQIPRYINSVIVDCDLTPLSRTVSQTIMASPAYHVIANLQNRAQAIDMMQEGKISTIIEIPPQFESDILNGIPASITLVTNGAFLVIGRSEIAGSAGPLEEAANAAIMAHLAEAGVPIGDLAAKARVTAPPMTIQSMYNTVAGYLSFAVSIVFVIIFQTVMICGTAMLLNDWFSRPNPPQPLRLGCQNIFYLFMLQAPVFCICFIWILIIEGAVFAWQGINAFQNIPATLLCGIFFSYAVTGLAILIGMIFKTSKFAIHFVVMSSLPCVFISGNLFPWQNIPVYMRGLAWFFPSTAGVDAMLRASQSGADPLEIFPYLMHLLFLGLVYFAWLGSLPVIMAKNILILKSERLQGYVQVHFFRNFLEEL